MRPVPIERAALRLKRWMRSRGPELRMKKGPVLTWKTVEKAPAMKTAAETTETERARDWAA